MGIKRALFSWKAGADLVFVIIASIKANQGESYKYPVTLTLIKRSAD